MKKGRSHAAVITPTACLYFAWSTTLLRVGGLAARLACIAAAAVPARPLQPPNTSDADTTQNAPVWRSGPLSSHHTRHNKSIVSVSCLAWRCEFHIRVYQHPFDCQYIQNAGGDNYNDDLLHELCLQRTHLLRMTAGDDLPAHQLAIGLTLRYWASEKIETYAFGLQNLIVR